MWRAFFLALGIMMIIVGGQFFLFESMEIKRVRRPIITTNTNQTSSTPYQQASFTNSVQPPLSKTIVFRPKDWMPWSLLAVGSIILIYTFTLPRRTFSE